MQNLVWKVVVLVGVIGASCGVVYQAQKSLSQAIANKDQADANYDPSNLGDLEDAPPADGSPILVQAGLEPVPTLAEPEPTLADPLPTSAEPESPRSLFADAMHRPDPVNAENSVTSGLVPIAAAGHEQHSLGAPTPPPAADHDPIGSTSGQVTPVAAESVAATPNPFAGFGRREPVENAERTRSESPFAPKANEEVVPSSNIQLLSGNAESPAPAGDSGQLRPHRDPILMPTPDVSGPGFSGATLTNGNEPPQLSPSLPTPANATDPFSSNGSVTPPATPNPFLRQNDTEVIPQPNAPASEPGRMLFGVPSAPPANNSEVTPGGAEPLFGRNQEEPTSSAASNVFVPRAPGSEVSNEVVPAASPFGGTSQPGSEPGVMVLPAQNTAPSSSPFLTTPEAPATNTEEVIPTPFMNRSNETIPVPQENEASGSLFNPGAPAANPVPEPTPAIPERSSPFSPDPQPRPEPVENVVPTGSPFLNSSVPATNPGVSNTLPGGLPAMGTGTVTPDAPRGPQQPELKIEKIAPEEAIVGEPIIYAIIVRNVGGSPAHKVVVEDRIPRGVDPKSLGTSPQAFITEDKLFWELDTLNPGDERKIQLRVTPIEAGDIGSVATVRFASSVAASIRVTAPKLDIEMQGPTEIAVGEQVPFKFKVTNNGNGEGRKVFIRAILPAELQHPGGNDIEYEVGSLPAGQSREVELMLTATHAGLVHPQALVTIDGNVKSDSSLDLKIIESRLSIQRTGPKQRFVNRPAAYTNIITNESSTPLTNIILKEFIPAGVDWTQQPGIDAAWDATTRTVTWTISQLAPGEKRQFVSQVLSTTAGEFAGQLSVADAGGNQAALDTNLLVKGFANIELDVQRPGDPAVAVGEQIAMRVLVSNDGTAAAKDVQATFRIPEGLQFVDAKGPVRHRTLNGAVTFDPLPEIPANGQQAFDIILTAAGENRDARVKVELLTADYEKPLEREERIPVYREP